jgi:hypothetical protein
MFAATPNERETDPPRFQVIAMSRQALFERLGDKLPQPHSTQRCLGFHPFEEGVWQINRCTHKSIFAYIQRTAKEEHHTEGTEVMESGDRSNIVDRHLKRLRGDSEVTPID